MKKDLRTIFSSFWLGGINFSSFSACNKPLRSPSGITQYFMVNLKTNLVLKKFRNVWKKKILEWPQNHGSVRGPLNLSPWNYNKLNSYNPTEYSQPSMQTLLRDLCIKASEGEQMRQARKDERERNSRDRCHGYSLELPTGLGERREIRSWWARSVVPSIPAWVIKTYYGGT